MKGNLPNSKNKQEGEFERIFSHFPLRCLERLVKFSYPDHQTKNRVTLLLRKKYSLTVPWLPCEQGLHSVYVVHRHGAGKGNFCSLCWKVAKWRLDVYCFFFDFVTDQRHIIMLISKNFIKDKKIRIFLNLLLAKKGSLKLWLNSLISTEFAVLTLQSRLVEDFSEVACCPRTFSFPQVI